MQLGRHHGARPAAEVGKFATDFRKIGPNFPNENFLRNCTERLAIRNPVGNNFKPYDDLDKSIGPTQPESPKPSQPQANEDFFPRRNQGLISCQLLEING